jgi:hypothetical protein
MMKKKPLKALTIRKMPDEVADAVRSRAQEAGLSFNRALISLLQERISGAGQKKKVRRDLSYIAGSWSDKEYADFSRSVAEQRKIDPKMWR